MKEEIKERYEKTKKEMIDIINSCEGSVILIAAEGGLSQCLFNSSKERDVNDFLKEKAGKVMHNLLAFEDDADLDGVKYE